MLFLYQQGDCRNFVREASHTNAASMPPQFYSGDSWPVYYFYSDQNNVEAEMNDFANQESLYADKLHKRPVPNYFLFYDDEKMDERVQRVQLHFPGLHHLTTIEAGWFDKLLHRLNEQNAIERIHIYKTE